jgi:hypothetical protein
MEKEVRPRSQVIEALAELSGNPSLGVIQVFGLCLLCLCFFACWLVKSRNDVIGYYELGSGNQKISLEIKPTGSYEEVITTAGTVVDRRAGRWQWATERVDFDSLWFPRAFAPPYIIRADASSSPGAVKYTEPGHWSLGAERHFGRTILVVFPDADVNFSRIKALGIGRKE